LFLCSDFPPFLSYPSGLAPLLPSVSLFLFTCFASNLPFSPFL
jgi:hypothetical protein